MEFLNSNPKPHSRFALGVMAFRLLSSSLVCSRDVVLNKLRMHCLEAHGTYNAYLFYYRIDLYSLVTSKN